MGTEQPLLSQVLSSWPCSTFYSDNIALALGIYKFFADFYFYTFFPGSWYNTKLENALGVHDVDKNTRCPCSSGWAVSRPKVGKWVLPNFHNISSVETGKTISSIHCRMKEYISKICLWNTMIKQETDQLFSQTTLNSNQIKKEYPEGIFLNINLNIFITFICWINLRITMYLSLFLKAAWSI